MKYSRKSIPLVFKYKAKYSTNSSLWHYFSSKGRAKKFAGTSGIWRKR